MRAQIEALPVDLHRNQASMSNPSMFERRNDKSDPPTVVEANIGVVDKEVHHLRVSLGHGKPKRGLSPAITTTTQRKTRSFQSHALERLILRERNYSRSTLHTAVC